MRFVGIDPSLSATGLACIEVVQDEIVGCWMETVKTKPSPTRLVTLSNAVFDFIDSMDDFTFVAIESLPANAMSAGLTGQAQGVIRHMLQDLSDSYVEISPASVKKAFTGSGKADKAAMIAKVKELGWEPANDNEADAFALAWCGWNLGELPEPKGGWKWNR